MHATLSGDVVRAGERARERFYDSSGYGHPVDGGALELAPVEAAHLLYRGDLSAVEGPDGAAMDFRAFLASAAVSEIAFLVYKDLRDRGFYLSPAREGWSDAPAARDAVDDPAVDFVVYPRGSGPWDDEVAYRVGVVSEREAVPATDLGDLVLAVVDEESALTYLATERRDVSGTSEADLPAGVEGDLLSDRLLLWDPPAALYDEGFYGQPLDEQAGDVIQLSLLEAAYLAGKGVLDVEGGADAVVERGREVEGERFDRRLRVYESLRERGLVPKTGYKFGADFRTYADVASVDDLGHSELLVRVLERDHTFSPRDLALDVRLAHGVRKEMVFALASDGGLGDGAPGIEWLSVTRLTP
ncbi:tRNA-intron lyase [Halosimplex marinum]|uniref:tRNA-intron lyase n=1 Tax=Halosimplex marinum TaxID=3396620 RepID=UPI003F56A5FF